MKFEVVHELPRRIRFRSGAPIGWRRERARVEQALCSVAGVLGTRSDVPTATLVVLHDGTRATRDALLRTLASLPEAGAPHGTGGTQAPDALRAKRREIVRSALWLAFGGAVAPVPRAAITAARATPFFVAAARALARRRIGVEVLDATAIGTAIGMGELPTASLITLLLGVGDYMKLHTEERARRELAAVSSREARRAWVRRDGLEIEVDRSAVRVGDTVVVRPGHVIAVDGRVLSGQGMVDQSSLTGEGLPVERAAGSLVYEGTALLEGRLEVEAREVGDATRLARIVKLVHESEGTKARAESRADRLADQLVPWVFGAAGLTAAATGSSARAASVLLVDYSCALKLAIPLSVKTCLSQGLRSGLLIRGGKFVEALASADTVVLDKTGTLTRARPKVVAVRALNGVDEATLLRDAACVEEHYPHPFAAAIQEEANRRGIFHRSELHGSVRYVMANGLESTVRGRRFLVGSRAFLARSGVDVGDDAERALDGDGRSLVYAGIDGRLVGAFAIEDPLRPEAEHVLASLRRLGIARLVLLTGDSAASARRAARLGFDEVHAEITPEEKAAVVDRLQREGRHVAMVGDGMNDAPALSKASVGISFQHGADLAKESADVVVLGQDLELLPRAILLARRAMERVHGNFRTIVGLNSALIALGALGVVPAALSAALHNTTTIVASLRSLRPYAT